jgi:hypothetical protein
MMNSRIPNEAALRNTRIPGVVRLWRGLRNRPTGNPSRIVTPAMKPRASV